jgi:hypothetical protein
MGICRYCHKKAGWFSDVHEDCVQKSNAGMESIRTCVADAVIEGKQYSDISSEIKKLAAKAALSQEQVHGATKEGWDLGAQQRSKAQPLSAQEQTAILNFMDAAGLSQAEIFCKTQGFYAIHLSNVIWQVLHGQITPLKIQYEPPPGLLPHEKVPGVVGLIDPNSFNLQRGEVSVYMNANVLLKQEVTARSYVGSYGGPSIRIASGLWYRLGSMRGHAEESTSLQDLDMGVVLITTRSIYFSGRERGINFRLPFSQIIRFQPYADAVGICRNGAREQIFAPVYREWADGAVTQANIGWFLFNILQALAARDADKVSPLTGCEKTLF